MTLFGLSSSQISSLFRKVRDRSGVIDLTFHDSRHLAVNRVPIEVKRKVVDLTLQDTELSPRELAVTFTDQSRTLFCVGIHGVSHPLSPRSDH